MTEGDEPLLVVRGQRVSPREPGSASASGVSLTLVQRRPTFSRRMREEGADPPGIVDGQRGPGQEVERASRQDEGDALGDRTDLDVRPVVVRRRPADGRGESV